MTNDSHAMHDKQASSMRRDVFTIEVLIREHYVFLYRYAYRLSGSRCDAEDLTQQCFLTAHRKLHQLREPKAARSWLFQILRTAFFRLCRKRQPVLESDAEMDMGSVVEEETDESFDLERLQERLGELHENFRLVLLMFYFEEKSYDEIAAELNIPIGTVMSRLSRAKAHLRSRIRPLEATK